MRNSLLIAIIIVVNPVAVHAAGNTTFDFLRLDVSARAAAMGGSFVTTSDDPNVIFYNPAGLATLEGKRVSFGFFKHLLDINSGYASFGTQIPSFGSIGVGIVYIDYGEFKQIGEEGQDIGTFSAGEFALSSGYADQLESGLRYGVNAKLIFSSIAGYHSSGAAVDLGLQYEAIPERLVLGASLMNLGTQFNPYVTTREKLPLDFKIGATIYPEHLPAAISLAFNKLSDRQEKLLDHLRAFSLGIEFTASPNVLLRFGYNNEQRRDLKIGSSAGLAGFSLGGGFTNGSYILDYAFTSYGAIGEIHRISIALPL